MPEVTGITLQEAKKILEEVGLSYIVEGEAEEETIIRDQLPKKGIEIEEGTEVILYVE